MGGKFYFRAPSETLFFIRLIEWKLKYNRKLNHTFGQVFEAIQVKQVCEIFKKDNITINLLLISTYSKSTHDVLKGTDHSKN